MRRAAVAVLQECIGRGLSTHPLCKIVIESVDFYSVTNLEVTLSHPLLSMIRMAKNHLIRGVCSLDCKDRQLFARAYARICTTPGTLDITHGAVHSRHGALLVYKELGMTVDTVPDEIISESFLGYNYLVPGYLDICSHLALASLLKILKLPSESCRSSAVNYLQRHPLSDWTPITSLIVATLTSPIQKQGCIAALSAVPCFHANISEWSNVLLSTACNTVFPIECRQEAIHSLVLLYAKHPTVSSCSATQETTKTILRLLDTDYTVDERGDVGSHIRMECIELLDRLIRIETIFLPQYIDLLHEQAYGRIDRLRTRARQSLTVLDVSCQLTPSMTRGLIYSINRHDSISLLQQSIREIDIDAVILECLPIDRLRLPAIMTIELLDLSPSPILLSRLSSLLLACKSNISILLKLVPLMQKLNQDVSCLSPGCSFPSFDRC